MNKVIINDYKEFEECNKDIVAFEGKTILLTGGTSLVFSYFVKMILLYNKNCASKMIKIISMVRNVDKAKLVYKDFIDDENLTIVERNVVERIDIQEHIDIIIHAASPASPSLYASDPCGTINANVIGTHNLLEFARQRNIKDFLFISSGEVYGQIDKDIISEVDYGYLDCASLRACYGEGKRAGETMCVAYAKQYGINTKLLRLAHVYAPNMPFDASRIVADFVKNVLDNEDIVLNSDGSAIRSFVYVLDVISAVIKVILHGESGEAYNVANMDEVYSIKQVAEILADMYKEKGLKVVVAKQAKQGYIKSPVTRLVFDTAKISKLGWEARVSVKDGCKRVIDSYRTD